MGASDLFFYIDINSRWY